MMNLEVAVQNQRVLIGLRKQVFLDAAHQDQIQLADNLGGPVITLHQQFAGASGGRGLKAVNFCQTRLQVKE